MAEIVSLRVPLRGGPVSVLARRELRDVSRRIQSAAANRIGGALALSGDQYAKPGRTPGASWIEKEIAMRRPVILCEMCWRKYGRWYDRVEYRGDWDRRATATCDGCARRFVSCVMFLPAQTFFNTLAEDSHGCLPNPDRRIYSP